MRDVVREVDVAIIGGGQAGLATGYYLRRAGLVPGENFVILDAGDGPGGAWPRMWDGLRLFSPASFSSLPGLMMPPWNDAALGFPPRQHVVDYLAAYESRYELRPLRPHRVTRVQRVDDDPRGRVLVSAAGLDVHARVVVSATGTWDQPFWPRYPAMETFAGEQLHAANYRNPDKLAERRVAVVGGGNSAAQILAEVSEVAETFWFTLRPPRFLPDDIDGRVLFAEATQRVRALQEGREHAGVAGLGDIVMVPTVRRARDRGALQARPMFDRLTRDGVAWADGNTEAVDTIIWCTGFRPTLRHLAPLGLRGREGRIATSGPSGTQAVGEPRLFLVGYGDWTGAASATLLGVGRTAGRTVAAINERLSLAGP
ncbi:ArsO family NAD(P)H-dependent flavin-containing monooxygenase [Nocardioides sp. J54]|uniref:ArsO family NAD(P)H-dependent flavin-containing monooxygenase n=1 Tax=Nocardioides sp. J54 TaxID=935866 RepID=UPI00048FE434|nr:ArsO family NAD(P)H-dependent flavin-containing monooxygenase [Nocardioides sp. J54]